MKGFTGQEHYALVANHRTGSGVIRKGALVYVAYIPGMNDRARCLLRSRGGRWVDLWVALKELENVRIKAISPGHYLYASTWFGSREDAERMRERVVRECR
jgi:hypothetical protein